MIFKKYYRYSLKHTEEVSINPIEHVPIEAQVCYLFMSYFIFKLLTVFCVEMITFHVPAFIY